MYDFSDYFYIPVTKIKPWKANVQFFPMILKCLSCLQYKELLILTLEHVSETVVSVI